MKLAKGFMQLLFIIKTANIAAIVFVLAYFVEICSKEWKSYKKSGLALQNGILGFHKFVCLLSHFVSNIL